jgi:hypothetical protein
MIEKSLNQGEIVYSKISKLLKYLKIAYTGLTTNKDREIIDESIASYLKRIGIQGKFEDNILIGLDIIKDPTNYLTGDVNQLESEISNLYDYSKFKLIFKELVNEYKDITNIIIYKTIKFRNDNEQLISSKTLGPCSELLGDNFNMLKDPYIMLKEMSDEEKYIKYG